MKKCASNYFESFPNSFWRADSNFEQEPHIPVSLLVKMLKKERIELKAKSLPRKKNFAN